MRKTLLIIFFDAKSLVWTLTVPSKMSLGWIFEFSFQFILCFYDSRDVKGASPPSRWEITGGNSGLTLISAQLVEQVFLNNLS